jgi:hypothetical protein
MGQLHRRTHIYPDILLHVCQCGRKTLWALE